MVVRHRAPIQDLQPHLAEHVAYLERLHAAGILLLSGPTTPLSDGGVLVARTVGIAEAEELSEQDPFRRHGLSEYEFIELRPRRADSRVAAIFGE